MKQKLRKCPRWAYSLALALAMSAALVLGMGETVLASGSSTGHIMGEEEMALMYGEATVTVDGKQYTWMTGTYKEGGVDNDIEGYVSLWLRLNKGTAPDTIPEGGKSVKSLLHLWIPISIGIMDRLVLRVIMEKDIAIKKEVIR